MKPRRAGKPAVTPFRPSRGLVALTVAAALVSVFVAWSPGRAANAGPDAWTAVVLDETGRPVPQATLALGGQHLLADADGRVAAQLTEPALVHAAAPGHLPRVQAVEPGRPAAITLTRRTPAVVSLRFAGDAMFGRRFHEPGPAPATYGAWPRAGG